MSGVEFSAPPDFSAVQTQPEQVVPQPRRRLLRGRGQLGPRSLTARLIAGVAVLVFIVVSLIGVGTWYSLRYFLDERLDQQLQATAGGSVFRLFEGNRDAGPNVTSPSPVWAVAIAPDGTSVFPNTVSVRRMQLSVDQKTMLANRSPADGPMTITTSDGVAMRVVIRPVQLQPVGSNDPADAIQAPAVIGLSTAEEHNTLSRLVNLELVIGASAVVLALVATSVGVRFSLRRLRRVSTTAREVAIELSPTGAGLDRRVDVPDDGTEVGQLAESMNTLLAAVETQFKERMASEARLRQFLADASHELRTPLTSIRGYAELARMQKAAGANAEDNLARIESEGTRMSRLVEDLLMLARGEQPAEADPARELVDVADLVDDAANGTRAAFPSREIVADAASGLMVIGDRDQLLRAVRNLVANAAAHTAPERPIRVHSLPDGDGVLIQVIDGGPGLPPDEAAHVFERFWRADKARTRARGGTGLGLSIVAAIVAAHGGTVRFDSSVEVGSTVTIRLPAVEY